METHGHTLGHLETTKASAELAIWTAAWVASLAVARFGPTHVWDSQEAASWVAIAANLGAGVGWIVAHARYLRRVDELQRKIMQDALALTLGVGLVVGFAYVVAEDADLLGFEASAGLASASLSVVYLVAIAVGHLRYR